MATYASLAELKVFLRIPTADVTDDVLLGQVLAAATESIDQALGTDDGLQLNPVPASILLACIIQSMRWYKRQDSPFGVLGSPDFGSTTRLLHELDADVQLLINGYGTRKAWGTTV